MLQNIFVIYLFAVDSPIKDAAVSFLFHVKCCGTSFGLLVFRQAKREQNGGQWQSSVPARRILADH